VNDKNLKILAIYEPGPWFFCLLLAVIFLPESQKARKPESQKARKKPESQKARN